MDNSKALNAIELPKGFSVGKDKHTGLPTIKVDVPGIVAQSGARRWLATRALHLPQAVVDHIAPAIQAQAEAYAQDHAHGTPGAEDFLRAVELTLVALLYDGVLMPAVQRV